MAQWYSAVDGKQQGPFEDAVFRQMGRQGQIPPDSLVWNETMTDWFEEVGPPVWHESLLVDCPTYAEFAASQSVGAGVDAQ